MIFARILKIGYNYIKNYYKDKNVPKKRKMRGPNDVNKNMSSCEYDKRIAHSKILINSIRKEGGILTKFSQLASMGDCDHNVYTTHDIELVGKTEKWFRNELKTNDQIVHVDFESKKCGSVAMVYFITMKDGKDAVVKIKYINIEKMIKSDFGMLKSIANYLYSELTDISDALTEIYDKTLEEVDFKIEIENQMLMENLWKDDLKVRIPKAFFDISTPQMLFMEKINGITLPKFIETATLEQRTMACEKIVYFIFKNLFVHKIFYADIHYGNFMINEDNEVYVIDFGCLIPITDEMLYYFKLILKNLKDKDKELFWKSCEEFGIIDLKTISQNSLNYLYEHFYTQQYPYICNEEFDFNEQWLENSLDKNIECMQEWKIPPNTVYFNKLPRGLTQVIAKLKGNPINYTKLIEPFISSSS